MSVSLQILFGLIGGIFGGMGMGGGTLLIPLLVIFLNFSQTASQGINLIAFLTMSLFSLFIHFKNGLVVLEGIYKIILSGIVFAVMGSLLANFLPTSILRKIYGVCLLVFGLYTIFEILKKQRKNAKK